LVHEGAGELLAFGDAFAACGFMDAAEMAFCRERLAMPAAQLNPPPLFTGDDLLKLGVPRGHVYAELLQKVREAQLDGQIKDRADAVELVKRFLDDARPPG
jgi:hypothetical protein